MHTRHISRWFWTAPIVVFLSTLTCVNTAAQPPVASSQVTTSGGLTVVTFKLDPGTIWVNLPDDMRAGDTISGTLRGEPKGTTEVERAANLAEMRKFRIQLSYRLGTQPTDVRWGDYVLFKMDGARDQPSDKPLSVGVSKETGPTLIQLTIPISVLSPRSIDPAAVAAAKSARWGDYYYPTPSGFSIPTIGQQGRPLEIPGPFDGNSSNTTLRFGPPGSTVQDFEKGTENVSGGFGLIRPLAESPRKLVFESPSNVTGPVTILVKEGDGAPTTGTMRNVGVNLSAPKTNLLKGEKTTLTVQVSGLEGIKQPVPLTLEARGVITMVGGMYQPLVIQPSEVGAGGRYTTTRGITGVQTGGWEATATVVTGRFNVWLQDDSDPNRLFHFNSFTGDYIFACGGGSCRPGGSTGGTQTGGTTGKPGGTTPPGGTDTPPIVPPPPVTLTGTGKPAMKGCIITLSHNAPDRRVFARLDACTKTGEASVETKSPKNNFNITDKNTTDSTATSPPPK